MYIMRIVNFKTFTKGQLGVFFAVLLLAVVWAPSLPFESALALPGCSGVSCHGLNPETMGCGTDAQTGPTKTWNYGKAQNRYSNACNAEWERTINTASWS
jgi:hypothetical protein